MLSRPRRTVLRAFTLLELIVVLVVLALLAALAIPTFSKVTRRADNEGVRTEVLASMRNMVAYAGISELSAVDIASVDAVVSETTGRAGRDVPFTRVSGASTKYGELSASVKDGVLSTAMVTRVGDCVVARVSALGVPSGEIKELDGAACLPDGSKDGEVVSEVEVEIPPLGPPATIVTWTCGDSRAELKWAPLEGATGYRILRQTGTGEFLEAVADVDEGYVDEQVQNGTTYAYYLVAFNTTDSWRASEVYTCTPGSPTPEVPPAPEGVFSPSLDRNADTRVLDVSWRPVLRASSYSVYVNGMLVGVTGSSKWDLRLDAVVNRDYALSISASNDGGTSAQSPVTVVRADQQVPPAPELRATTVSTDGADLEWSAPDARSLRLYQDGVLVGSYDARFTSSSTIRDLTSETAYTFSARSVNSAGESEPGFVVVVTSRLDGNGPQGPVTPKPPTPGPVAETDDEYRLRASASYDRVVLNWQGVSGATAYDVYSGSVLLGNTTDLTWTHLGLSEATTYSYFLVAKTGVAPLAPSDVVRVTTRTRGPSQIQSVPVTPSGVSVLAGDRRGTASWTSVDGATSYRLYLDGLLTSSTVASAAALTGLTNGRTYSLRVSAVNAAGESAQSASVTFTPAAPVPTGPTAVPDVPGAFTARADGTKVVLAWASAARADVYQVYRDGVLASQVGTTSFVLELPGESHSWSVRAANTSGASAQTARIAVSTLPAVPVVSGTAASGELRLTWTQSGPATSWTVLVDGAPRATTSTRGATVAGLANGVPITVTVTATGPTGTSETSRPLVLTPITTPAAPSGLRASNDPPAVVLTWMPAASTAAAPILSQQVYRDGVMVASTGLGGSWTDSGARPDTTHVYRVATQGAAGLSAQSAPATVRTPPSSPRGLVAVVDKAGAGVGVTWSSVSGATAYALERDGVEVYRGPVTAYSDRSAAAGSGSSYRVRAVGTGGPSAYSTTVAAVAVPAAPFLSGRALDQRVVLTWTSVPTAASYSVYRQGPTGGFVLAAPALTSLEWTDPTVFNAASYTYYVVAVNVAGQGDPSASVTMTPNIAVPSAPSSASASVSTSGVPTVTWAAATGTAIASYNVWKGTVLVGVVNAATRTWTGPALNPGETATFSVSASNAGGEGPRRSAAAVVRPGPPSAPSALAAEGFHQEIALRWNVVASTPAGPVSGYRVYVDGVEVLTTTNAYASLSNLENGRTYSISVSTYGSAGTGARSGEVSATPVAGWSKSLPKPATANTFTGLFEYLGRTGNGGTWVNPATSGAITADVSVLTNRVISGNTGQYGSGVFDLGPGMRMNVTDVDAPLYNGSAGYYVQGSNNGKDWFDIKGLGTANTAVLTPTQSWRYIRSTGSTYELELYGTLRASAEGSIATAPTVSYVHVGNNEVSVGWVKDMRSGGLPTLGYRVYVDGVRTNEITNAQTTSVMAPASNGVAHNVQVSAVNVLGEGPLSAPRSITPTAPLASFTRVGGYVGLFDYLGARANNGVAANPANVGVFPKNLAFLFDNNASTYNTAGILDLGPNLRMTVKDLQMPVYNSSAHNRLEVSNDATKWTALYSVGYEPVPYGPSTEGWRYIRTMGYIEELELYGDLRQVP